MRPGQRLLALDRLRSFLIALVVLHHAMLAYCHFGHINHRHYVLSTAPVVDARRWAGFDILVALNDAYFMPLMFLLSGLFVRSSLGRKGIRPFLNDRLLRLGVPFAAAVLTVVPLAYYPSWLEAGGAPGFLAFWATMVTAGPWPSGPPWFVAVLLAFDGAAATVFVLLRRSQKLPATPLSTPSRAFALLLVCLVLTYLPLLAAFGPSRWIGLGPLAVQASRIGLYAISFAAGAVLGTEALEAGVSPFRDALIRRWPSWMVLAGFTAAILIATLAARIRFGSVLPLWLWLIVQGIALASFCATACFALPALFLRFAGRSRRYWESFAACSYGIYLVHYPIVTWTQYGLLDAPLAAVIKAPVTFAVAVLTSWIATSLLRRAPGISQLI